MITLFPVKDSRIHPLRQVRSLAAVCLALTLALLTAIACSPTRRASRIDSAPPTSTLDENATTLAPEESQLARPTGPDKAMRWRRLAWRDENGRINRNDFDRGRDEWLTNTAHFGGGGPAFGGLAAASDTGWIEHGPTNVAGRTRSLLIDPGQPSRMIAGSVGGGIFTSDDGGLSWIPRNETLPILSIGSMTMDPADPLVLYAGTGEGQFNSDAIGGDGIFRSTDGGLTWTQLASTNNWDTVNRIAIAPNDSTLLLASKRYGGIRRSTNAGEQWTNVYSAQGSYDVEFNPLDGAKAVAHIIDYDFGTDTWFHRAIYSTNGGASWQVAAGLDHIDGFSSRIELAYAPTDPTIVYALTGAEGGVIWKSIDGGASYVKVTTSGTCNASWYACPLWVSPTNPNDLLCGGTHVFRSTDGGVTLNKISDGYILTEETHPDIHGFLEDPGFNGNSNRRVYVVTDGGVYVAPDLELAAVGTGWSALNSGYRSSQFYGATGMRMPYLPAVPVSGDVAGLTAKYYLLSAPTQLPDFAALTPYLTTSVPNLDYPVTNGVFANSGQSNNFGGLYTGWINLPTTDLYRFFTDSDDGSRLYIDGHLVVRNNGTHAMTEKSGLIGLEAGKHEIRVEFFEAGGGAGLITRYKSSTAVKQVIPPAMLSREGSAGAPGASPGATHIVYGGTQDNGSLRVIDDGLQAGYLTFGGDGGWVAIDFEDWNHYYGEYVNLRLHRSRDAGNSASYIYAGLTDAETGAANFIAPFVMDPNDPIRLYAGGESLWRTDDARAGTVAWTPILAAQASNISAIAVAPGHAEIVWVGRNNGTIWKTTDALTVRPTWIAVDDNAAKNPLPDRNSTRIVIDDDDPDVVYACFGGFSLTNIWRSVDGGVNWTTATGSGAGAFPSVPVRGFARHPQDSQRLYAGTEFGVVASSDGGLNWIVQADGPAHVSVDEVRFIHGTSRLVAATHGRGMWSIELALLSGDLDGDGDVDALDLGLLLGSWGADGAADLNGDGVVGAADLAILLGDWGP